MFRRSLLASLFLLVLCGGLLTLVVFHEGPEGPLEVHPPAAPPQATQHRGFTTKEIFLSNGETITIESQNSTLTLFPTRIETLHQVRGTTPSYTFVAPEVTIDYANSTLEASGPLSLDSPFGSFTSDKLYASLENQEIRAVGHVVMQNEKGQAALADEALYHPKTKQLTLKGNVLFFDQGGEQRISANEIVIDRQNDTVEGKGKVSFSLTQAEEARLQKTLGDNI